MIRAYGSGRDEANLIVRQQRVFTFPQRLERHPKSVLSCLRERASCLSLAKCSHCWHYESMAVQINIRDVPEEVRDELAARAALQGKSMQEFLRAELERLAARPSIDAWLQQVRKRATQTRISSKQILENRNADRR
jgi:plasmid stability protein